MHGYICNYSDYPDRPDVLFCGNTPGKERKSIDGLKFVVRCEEHIQGEGYINWLDNEETKLSKSELLDILNSPQWNQEE